MTELIYRFSVDAVKLNKQVLVCSLAVWMIVIGCTIMSIVGQPFSKKQRMFWVLMVVGVPLFGLLSYLPFSIRKENYPGLFNNSAKKKK
jgi:hypothetical protein